LVSLPASFSKTAFIFLWILAMHLLTFPGFVILLSFWIPCGLHPPSHWERFGCPSRGFSGFYCLQLPLHAATKCFRTGAPQMLAGLARFQHLLSWCVSHFNAYGLIGLAGEPL
jgi:hypothetical protein